MRKVSKTKICSSQPTSSFQESYLHKHKVMLKLMVYFDTGFKYA